jgi:TolB-like protein/Flp pilus assembly protein TadD
MSRFLRFVVERQLEGRDSELKESLIGVEVFGRRPGFDPQQDSTVRSEAARLRARLAEYYAGEGSGDAVVIELPKGGYTPRFRQHETADVTTPQTENDESKTPARRRWLMIALAGLAVAIAAGGWRRFQRQTSPIPIAVLPLTNVSQDPAADYFADGLTHELIRNLSIIDGLVVRSQTSSFAFKGKQQTIRDAGKQLNADYILEGSVFRSGQQLRINARLVRVRDDFPLWTGAYDKELTDVFAIQDEISRGIVNSLRLKLGGGRRRYETSVEAYDLYLHARAQPQRSRPAAQAIAGLYRQVIAKDPSFAPAYAGLAAAYAASSFQGFMDHTDELMQMRTAAEKAIALDPLLSEAHQALGMIYARDGLWAQSEKSFRRAIQLEPGNSLAYSDLTLTILLPLGRIEEGVHEMRTAEKTDPLSPSVQNTLSWALLSAGRYEEAASHCQKAAETTRCLGRARLAQGRIDEAIQILNTGSGLQYLGYAYGRAGRREEAEKFAADAAPNAFTQALTFAGLGDKDRTLEALDRLASLGALRVGRALNSPEFALLRGDPRVKALRKKVGLPQ